MKNWSLKKKVLSLLLVLSLGLQALQPLKDKDYTKSETEVTKAVPVTDTVFTMLKAACYDCHSNQTIYPWYSTSSPVNWWLWYHIQEGKRELNFSAFGEYGKEQQAETLEAKAETVRTGATPLESYRLMHPEANLSGMQKRLVMDWAIKMGQDSSP